MRYQVSKRNLVTFVLYIGLRDHHERPGDHQHRHSQRGTPALDNREHRDRGGRDRHHAGRERPQAERERRKEKREKKVDMAEPGSRL